MGDIPPCPTIYVNNLNEKIKKDGARRTPPRSIPLTLGIRPPVGTRAIFQPRRIPSPPPRARRHDRSKPPTSTCSPPDPRISCPPAELKKSLVAVCSQFGKVIDVVAAKTYKLRGQAWVVFDNVASATAAVRGLQDFPFYEKPMRITYAKSKSDATAKLEGTYDPATRDPEVRAKRKAESQRAEREARAKKEEAGEGAGPGKAIPTDPAAPPNEILFVQGLPGTHEASLLVAEWLGFATKPRARVFSSSDSTLHIPIKLSEQRVTTKHLRIEDDPRRVPRSSRRVSFRDSRATLTLLVRILFSSRRGDDGADVVDALPAVPRVQGGAHGGGETRDRVRGVRDGDAGERRALGAAGVQDQPHAQHDALVRQKVSRRARRIAAPRRRRVTNRASKGRGGVFSRRTRVPLSLRALHTSRWRGGRIAVGGRRDETTRAG